nr:immunoglobulin heavy chain junction region [Macaca mulatta]MOX92289.1 immunoglobulin heavy chain junction region [Macaca mulatta]MOX92688.1 immunoglobulin heavy chain junction region [Macaca mulatta]MOX93044.1 immunoglobulin heavy chain junction region [Macaca mulatta]MOX93220.1 immunoglobulin heavy chain junction region [Macaca mulatta]
CMFTDYGLDSW